MPRCTHCRRRLVPTRGYLICPKCDHVRRTPMTTLQNLWNSIPLPARTIINVVFGAAFAALVAYLTGVVSGGTFELTAAWQAVITAAMTALVRALNPLDGVYGAGADRGGE